MNFFLSINDKKSVVSRQWAKYR